ncbi:MAG: cytochrome b N-terminal domain-containing protein [Candidatus Dormibacteraeota bacterium]|nr:cytochrome b N-terminal domain-containing protein [Candidatus Dormibacteraeota bacterium]
MRARLSRYVDERTGLGPVLRYVLDRRIPSGISWLHTFGSASLTLFILMVVTGMFLALNYAPSISDAHASTAYIQHQVPLGGFVLGLHYWGASAMVVLVVVHLLRVFFMGAYKFPRELNWMLGVVIFALVLLFAFTGYLLPWDNTAFFATRVGVNIVASVPLLGNALAALLRGGADIGAATLTHFYAIHVLFLPAIVTALIAGHLFLVVRNGIAPLPRRAVAGRPGRPAVLGGGPGAMRAPKAELTEPEPAPAQMGDSFYPRHVLMDAITSLLVLLVVVGLALLFAVPDSGNANPGNASFIPRPAWYFLAPFQLLKYVPGPLEALATAVLPLVAGGALFLLPLLDRRRGRHPFDRPAVTLIGIASVIGIVTLTLVGAYAH